MGLPPSKYGTYYDNKLNVQNKNIKKKEWGLIVTIQLDLHNI